MASYGDWAIAKMTLINEPEDRDAQHRLDLLMRKVIGDAGLTLEGFGHHWHQVRQAVLNEVGMSLQHFEYCTQIFKKMSQLGCAPEMVEWDHIMEWYHLEADSDEEWLAKVQTKVLHHLASIGSQERQTELPLAMEAARLPGRPGSPPNGEQVDLFETGGERANAGEPGEFLRLIVGSQNDGDQAVVVCEPWLGPQHIGAMREKPQSNDDQVILWFPEGRRMYPLALLQLSVEDRFNLPDEVVAFEREACLAQLPTTIPEPHYTACLARIRRMNIRVRSSSQDSFKEVSKAVDYHRPAKFVDVMAALCFVHFNVQEDSKNKFLRRQLKELDLLELADPTFPFATNLDPQAETIKSREGKVLANVTLDPPAPKRRQNRPRRVEDTKEGKKLKRRKIHVFSHVDAQGRRVYKSNKTFYDMYIQVQHKMAELRQQEFDICICEARLLVLTSTLTAVIIVQRASTCGSNEHWASEKAVNKTA